MFLDIRILKKKAVIITVCGMHLDTKFVKCLIGHFLLFFGYFLYDVFDEGSNSVHLSE